MERGEEGFAEDSELAEVFSTPHGDDYSRYLATPSDDEDGSGRVFSPTARESGRWGPKRSYVPPAGGDEHLRSPVALESTRTRAQVLDITDARQSASSRRKARDVMLNEMKDLLLSVNIFGGRMSQVSRCYCLLVVLSGVGIIGVAIYMLVDQVTRRRSQTVLDGTVCQGTHYDQGNISSINYNITVFVINAVFCMWFAVRAVNLEKAGNLFCFLVSAAFQIGRVSYFCFGGTLNNSYPSNLATVLEWCLLGSVGLLCIAMLFTHAVYKRFGWLRYAKGVTQARQIDQLHRHNRFDTAVKLDTFVSTNGLISVIFLVSSVDVRVAGTAVISVTVILLLFFKLMIKRQQTWFLITTIVVGLVSPAFYVYAVLFLLEDSGDRCYDTNFTNCLATRNNPITAWHYNVSIGLESETPAGSTFVATNASTGLGFILDGCNSQCYFTQRSAISAFIDSCCQSYGLCTMLADLREHDEALMIAVAVAAVVIRVASLSLGYLRRKEMAIPSVQEMFKRAERNLRELKQAAFQLRHSSESEGTINKGSDELQ